MKTFKQGDASRRPYIILAAVMLAATILGGCSTNMQMAQENATLKAKLAEREREEARLRAQLLAPDGLSSAQLSSREAEAAPSLAKSEAPASGWKAGKLPTAYATPAATPLIPAPAFQRAGTVGPGVGYLNRDPMDGRPCGGMCLELRNRSPYYMLVMVNSREMTVFAGYQAIILPANVAKLSGGRQARTASLVPPGEVVKTAMDSVGSHQIRVVFYTAIPGQPYLQPVGVWDMTEKFPYETFGHAAEWGRYQEVYRPTRKIDTY